MKMRTVFMLALGLAAPPAFAQPVHLPGQGARHADAYRDGGMPPSEPQFNAPPEVSGMPREKRQNDVAYLCGGVGENEASYMKEQANSYDLMLTFATRAGSYLANVDVNIKDAHGNSVLQTRCDAPMLLVDLPASGTYRIRAETSGYSLDRSAQVNASHRRRRVERLAMVWPQKAVGGGETASGASGTAGRSAHGGPDDEDDGMDEDTGGAGQRSRMYQDNGNADSR